MERPHVICSLEAVPPDGTHCALESREVVIKGAIALTMICVLREDFAMRSVRERSWDRGRLPFAPIEPMLNP